MGLMLDVPFVLGQTYWVAETPPTRKEVTCPVCFGKLAVIVELGDGERVGVPCAACDWGFEGPHGWVPEYDWTPAARAFVPVTVTGYNANDSYYLADATGATERWASLHADEAAALAAARKHIEDSQAQQYGRRQHKRSKGELSRAAWSVRYHREQIADLTRKMQWHMDRVRKSSTPTPPPGAQERTER